MLEKPLQSSLQLFTEWKDSTGVALDPSSVRRRLVRMHLPVVSRRMVKNIVIKKAKVGWREMV